MIASGLVTSHFPVGVVALLPPEGGPRPGFTEFVVGLQGKGAPIRTVDHSSWGRGTMPWEGMRSVVGELKGKEGVGAVVVTGAEAGAAQALAAVAVFPTELDGAILWSPPEESANGTWLSSLSEGGRPPAQTGLQVFVGEGGWGTALKGWLPNQGAYSLDLQVIPEANYVGTQDEAALWLVMRALRVWAKKGDVKQLQKVIEGLPEAALWPLFEMVNTPLDGALPLFQARARAHQEYLVGPRLLEVGAGQGDQISTYLLAGVTGWSEVLAVELDPILARRLERRGPEFMRQGATLTVSCQRYEEAEVEGRFDCLTLRSVLETVADSRTFLTKARREAKRIVMSGPLPNPRAQGVKEVLMQEIADCGLQDMLVWRAMVAGMIVGMRMAPQFHTRSLAEWKDLLSEAGFTTIVAERADLYGGQTYLLVAE